MRSNVASGKWRIERPDSFIRSQNPFRIQTAHRAPADLPNRSSRFPIPKIAEQPPFPLSICSCPGAAAGRTCYLHASVESQFLRSACSHKKHRALSLNEMSAQQNKDNPCQIKYRPASRVRLPRLPRKHLLRPANPSPLAHSATPVAPACPAVSAPPHPPRLHRPLPSAQAAISQRQSR